MILYDQKLPLQASLMTCLQRLMVEEHVPPGEIAVLTPYSHQTSRLKATPLLPTAPAPDIALRWFASDDSGHVQLTTIHAFKGLERPVIILAEIERWLTQGVKAIDIQRLLYVACSRARNYLIVLLPRDVPAQVSQFFTGTPPV